MPPMSSSSSIMPSVMLERAIIGFSADLIRLKLPCIYLYFGLNHPTFKPCSMPWLCPSIENKQAKSSNIVVFPKRLPHRISVRLSLFSTMCLCAAWRSCNFMIVPFLIDTFNRWSVNNGYCFCMLATVFNR